MASWNLIFTAYVEHAFDYFAHIAEAKKKKIWTNRTTNLNLIWDNNFKHKQVKYLMSCSSSILFRYTLG